jgi:hypothetical protein
MLSYFFSVLEEEFLYFRIENINKRIGIVDIVIEDLLFVSQVNKNHR